MRSVGRYSVSIDNYFSYFIRFLTNLPTKSLSYQKRDKYN